ncbi:MAG: hypothetical protein LBJ74_01355 [Heliobacteriaceae bacterium]|nr:hypothetical protein [Heliobacteriaceae bacterium]
MSLSVYNSQFKTGIDTSVLKEVSQEILRRAAAKSGQNNTGSSFLGADLGVDLYKGSVDANTARQIAMNNSGLNVQLNQNVMESIKFLNTQAAVHKNIECKITIAVNEASEQAKAVKSPAQFNSIVSLAAGKDKHGSNPSYRGELLQIKKEEKEENNIFGGNVY